MKRVQKKSSNSKRKVALSEIIDTKKNHLIIILCCIYISLILIFGLVFMSFQDEFVIGESMKKDKIRKDYIEYMESFEELWYGADLNYNKISQNTIDNLLVEIDLFDKDLVYINHSSNNGQPFFTFPSRYSLSPSDDDSVFSTYAFNEEFGNNILPILSEGRVITFSSDLEPISSNMAVFYMELIENNFTHYKIANLYTGDYWLRKYDIKTDTTISEVKQEDVYYVTLEFMNEDFSTKMCLLLKDEMLGEVYENIIEEKFSSGESYLIEDDFYVETINYISQPDGQEGSLDFGQAERFFLYSLISSNAVYMGDPMGFEEKEIGLNYWDCVFISAMYATTTGYADVTISNDLLKLLASVEAVVENGIVLAMIVGLLTSAIEKKREN